MVHLGYYNRPLSTVLFLTLLAILFFTQKKIATLKKIPRPFYVALVIAIPLIISYPFLSRDFFNYMFDAKIVTVYHQNPYLLRALDFPADPWLRFMHWTHRTYPYGPVFLLITLIPSFLSFGKLLLSILAFKATWTLFYLGTVFLLEKKYKAFALFFATSPLIIIEGLVNNHNDLIAICLTIIGLYFLFNSKKIKGYFGLLLSVGIKYFTLPFLLIQHKNRKINLFVFWLLVVGMGYIGVTQEMQPWYLLNLVPFLLVSEKMEGYFTVASLGVLLSYYPYIAIGDWTNVQAVVMKHIILLTTTIFVILAFVIRKTSLFRSDKV